MHRNKKIQRLVISVAILVLVAFTWQSVIAQRPTDRLEVQVDFGDYIDISIGNSGVSQEDSGYRGTIVVEKYESPPDFTSWRIWTQKYMDVRIYENSGRLYDATFGIMQVYFDLDRTQRNIWETRGSNMSIWHYDITVGHWVKCPTIISFHLEDYPHGRLSCSLRSFGLYGLAWTQPTIEMKLTKAALTATPTPTP